MHWLFFARHIITITDIDIRQLGLAELLIYQSSFCNANCILFCYLFHQNSGNYTISSAIAEGQRDVQFYLKACQLLYNCTKNNIWKGLQRVND